LIECHQARPWPRTQARVLKLRLLSESGKCTSDTRHTAHHTNEGFCPPCCYMIARPRPNEDGDWCHNCMRMFLCCHPIEICVCFPPSPPYPPEPGIKLVGSPSFSIGIFFLSSSPKQALSKQSTRFGSFLTEALPTFHSLTILSHSRPIHSFCILRPCSTLILSK